MDPSTTVTLTWHPEQRVGTDPETFLDSSVTYPDPAALRDGLSELFATLVDGRNYCWDETVFVREPRIFRTHPRDDPSWEGLRIELDRTTPEGEAALDAGYALMLGRWPSCRP